MSDMKKLLTILVLLLAVVSQGHATDTVLFTAEVPVVMASDWSKYVQLSQDKFSSITESDGYKFRICVKDVDEGAQLAIQNSSWSNIGNEYTKQLQSTDTYVDFNLTGTLLTSAQSGGLIVKGTGFTAYSIEIYKEGANTRLWGGVVMGNWARSLQISNTSFPTTINAGDYITITYSDASSAQIYLNDNSWITLASESVADGSGTMKVYLTPPMISKISNGIIISGCNATITKVDIASGDNRSYANTIWLGEKTLNGSNYQKIEKVLFDNAQTDYILRVNYKDLNSSPSISLKYVNGNDWTTLPGSTDSELTGGSSSKDYTITSEMRTALQSGGLIVGGNNYTLTSVEVVPAYQVTATADDSNKGTVALSSGSSGDSFEYGTSIKVTATPKNGYEFDKWTKTENPSWSSTSNPLSIEELTSAWTLTGSFKDATFVTPEGETLLSNTTQAKTNWEDLEISTSTYNSYKEGDKIRVYVKAVNTNAVIQIQNRSDWTAMNTTTSLATDATVFEWTVSGAGNVSKMNSNGLKITGKDYTVWGVTIVPLPKTVKNLSTGSRIINASSNVTISKEMFANAIVGDVITVNVSNVKSGAKYSLSSAGEAGNDTYDWKWIEGNDLAADATTITHTLTETTLANIKAAGLFIAGNSVGGYTCGDVTLTTAYDVPTAQTHANPSFTLTVAEPVGGTITIKKGAETVTAGTFELGTELTLTAAAKDGYAFQKWQKDGADAGTSSTLNVTIDADMTIAALFKGNMLTYEEKRTLFEGSTALDWSGVAIQPSTVGEILEAGEELILTTTVAEGAYGQVQVRGADKTNEITSIGGLVNGENKITLTSAMVEAMRAEFGFWGADATLTKVELYKPLVVFDTDGVADLSKIVESSGKSTFTLPHEETINGNVLVVESTEAATVKVTYTDGTTATNKAGSRKIGSPTAAQALVVLNTSKYIKTIEIDKAKSSIGKVYMATLTTFEASGSNFMADLSLAEAEDNVVYENKTYTIVASQGWTGIQLKAIAGETVKGAEVMVKVASDTKLKTVVYYTDGTNTAEAGIMSQASSIQKLAIDNTKTVQIIEIQPQEAGAVQLTEVLVNATPTVDSTYKLTVTAENGTVKISPEKDAYDEGEEVKLTATAAEGYEFSKWQKADGTDYSTDNPLTVKMTADMTLKAVFADTRYIWQGSTAINWNNGVSQSVTIDDDVTLDIADKLVFNITPTIGDEKWPQLQLNSLASGTPLLVGAANTSVTADTKEISYSLTKAMLKDITTNGGLIVSGVGFTLNHVRKVAGPGSEGYENAIWIGETVYGSDWNVYQTIVQSCFKDAKAGQVLRIRFKDVQPTTAMSLSYSNAKGEWTTLPGTEMITPSGLSTKITLTDEVLSAIRTEGQGNLYISGVGFTLTSVDVVDATSQKSLTCKVPITHNLVWESSESPVFTIEMTNPNDESMTAEAQLIVVTDKAENVTTLKGIKTIAANASESISFTVGDLKPGIYRATAVVNDETVPVTLNGQASNSFNFAFAPTAIVSKPDKQSDFDDYWTGVKKQLDGIDIKAKLTEIPSKTGSKRKVYLVEMLSIPDGTSGDPVTIRGYYAEPTDGKKHPVLMTYLGYDSDYAPAGQSREPYCPDGDSDYYGNYAEFVLSTRGQSVNNRKSDERVADGLGDFTNTYGDWFAYNFGKKDGWYYRGAYMDCVRALQFMASRETSDMDNLFAQGQSQGGALTYAAAALSGYTFKAIAPAITFMGDFPDYFQIVNWPADVAKKNQGSMTDAEMYAFLSYFDTKNLATKVTCPVITSIGIQDNVCPPHTNIAPYNNLPSGVKKAIIYNAELYHATNSDWTTDYMAFFKKYDTSEDSGSSSIFDKDEVADLEKMAAQDPATTKVTYDTENGSIQITTTEAYKAAQIWFDTPEKATGNVLRVEIAESGVNVTVSVQYTDGTESSMSSTASSGAREYKAMTRAAGTVISVPVEIGKDIQNIEVKNAKAGTITITKMQMIVQNVFDSKGRANLSMMKPQSNATYDVTTHTLATTKGWTGATITPVSSENVSGKELLIKFAADAQVKVSVTYRTGVDGPSTIMDTPAKSVRLALDNSKAIQEITIQPTKASILTFEEVVINGYTTIDPIEQIFVNGKADLSKFVPQDENKVIYDKKNYVIRATEGWTGVQVELGIGQEVSGQELTIRFAETAKVKAAVTYTDGTSESVIMDEADALVRVPLDNSKKIRKIEIQPTEACNVTLKEVSVSGQPDTSYLLKEGETRDLWESEEGDELTWNEVGHQKKSLSSQLRQFDEILITISGVSEGNEWPKVFLRDGQSETVGEEILLNEVTEFPYVVRIPLTVAMAEQMANGFSVCGDGIIVTKLQVYRPYAAESGDIHLSALNYGYHSEYNEATTTITTTARWAARGWTVGDDRYNYMDLVLVEFAAVDFPVTLKMEYTDDSGEQQAYSAGVAGGSTAVSLVIPSDIQKIDRVYLTYQQPGDLVLKDANVINATQARSRGITEDSRGIAIGDNSQLNSGVTAVSDGKWYTLSGLRVIKPGKGVYIHKGKKVVIK